MLLDQIAKGFDFLGYSFEPKGLSIAPKTLANFLERKTQYSTIFQEKAIMDFIKGIHFLMKQLVQGCSLLFSQRKN